MTNWTHEERNVLRALYYMVIAEELALKLPRFTRVQMTRQVNYLKRVKGWAFKKP